LSEVFVGGKTSGKRGRGAEGKSLIAVAVEVKGRKTGRVRITAPVTYNEVIKENHGC
jgi:hypothetical protein